MFLGGVAKVYEILVMVLRITNMHFWRHCRGWILSLYLVIALRNANKHFLVPLLGKALVKKNLVGYVHDNIHVW